MKKLNIIYEDKNLLVVDKEANYLTIGTAKNKIHTLYHEVREYIKKKNQKVFIVNRLDKDKSGLVVFAKNEKLKYELQSNWNNIAKRYYYAIVEGRMPKKEDTLINYLKETKTLDVVVTNDKRDKKCILIYKEIESNKNYSLLDIEIKSGRRNQIRCQLNFINHPIIGDKKYNSKKNPINRLGLHAYKIILKNPSDKKEYIFVSNMSKKITNFFEKIKK